MDCTAQLGEFAKTFAPAGSVLIFALCHCRQHMRSCNPSHKISEAPASVNRTSQTLISRKSDLPTLPPAIDGQGKA
jgi:hypothetical protein